MVVTFELLQSEASKEEVEFYQTVLIEKDKQDLFDDILINRLVDNKSHENIDMNYYDPFYGGV